MPDFVFAEDSRNVVWFSDISLVGGAYSVATAVATFIVFYLVYEFRRDKSDERKLYNFMVILFMSALMGFLPMFLTAMVDSMPSPSMSE